MSEMLGIALGALIERYEELADRYREEHAVCCPNDIAETDRILAALKSEMQEAGL